MMPAANHIASMSLANLLQGIVPVDSSWQSITPTGLCLDSRKITPGDIFFAMSGHVANGLCYAKDVLNAGAVVLLHQTDADDLTKALAKELKVPLIYDPQLEQHLGEIAARYYQHPSDEMEVVAVTGTDGKTSVSYLLAQALNARAIDSSTCAAVIGTIGSGFLNDFQSATHTTPDAISLQSRMHELLHRGASHIVMEASSHGLEQGRMHGTRLEVAILTNLGRDHLDYHKDLEAYREAKQRLFYFPHLKGAVLNWHDPFGRHLQHARASAYPITMYGVDQLDEIKSSGANDWVCATQLECVADGLQMHIVMPDGAFDLSSKLLGEFNALNILAVAAALRRLNCSVEEICRALPKLTCVPGRMQRINCLNQPQVVIDYAHTPQALRSALSALRIHCQGKLWCVFGCGGDRDIGKRSQMGAIAESLADRIIITNDNPRHEAPERIAEDIQGGMSSRSGVLVVLDRAEAIASALQQADNSDLILIAGKGHETTQQVGDDYLPFNDQLVIEQYMGIMK